MFTIERLAPLDEERAELVQQGQADPVVARALVIFAAASERAPYVPPPPQPVYFSTGTNG